MPKIMMFLLATILGAAMPLTGCSGDNGGSNAAPKAGQSTISLHLSGGHLSDTLEFSGTFDNTMSIFSSSMTYLGPGLDLTASNGTAVFKQMTLSIESSEAGTYPVKDVSSDMVFRFPDVNKGYSLRPREGTGTVKVERLDGDHVRLHLDFDASPTNIRSKDLIFHVEGVLESRPRVRD